LILEAFELILNKLSGFKGNTNTLLEIVLVLEIVSLVLALGKLLLKLSRWVSLQLVGEVGTLRQHVLKA